MKRKILCESLKEFLLEKGEPLALTVLGAPAGGKSYTMKNISKSVKDARITDTLKSGVDLTIDKLRSEFQSKDPLDQLKGFVYTFYFMKNLVKQNPDYTKWFDNIKSVWNKISKLMPSLEIIVDDHDLKFKGISAYKNMHALNTKSYPINSILKQLDRYYDYKSVIRYFQNIKQDKAIDKQINVSYDESGDEPQKILNKLTQLHKSGYVTDVFLIHPENVASNLIQNYYRVITGNDGGRDSSDVIVQAYLDIEKSKKMYKVNAEDKLKTSSKELASGNLKPEVEKPIEHANVPDDPKRGDKPIDIFAEVTPMKPLVAYKFFNEKLNSEQQLIFKAILKYRMLSIENLPENAKDALNQITKSINNKQALEILKKAAESKKYVFKYGGITPELVKKASKIMNIQKT